jgi:uncharacterized protein (TIGR03435 family)
MKRDEQGIKEIFDQSFPMPSPDQTATTCERVFQRLNAVGESPAEGSLDFVPPERSGWRRIPILAGAALAVLVVSSIPLVKVLISPARVYAVVETAHGSVYRVTDGASQAVNAGERIEADTPVRTDGAGAVLKLQDGSRIEMYEKSELSLERTNDGTRIRLKAGSVHVTPSKQVGENLYVSQVAVPATGGTFRAAAPQIESGPRFEVISIRPSALMLAANRGLAPGERMGFVSSCPPNGIQLSPGRFVATNMNLRGLIGLAYGKLCAPLDVVYGEPKWSEWFDIEAIMLAGSPVYTPAELFDGKAPELQRMLQHLLADRFKLTLRREMKDVPVYNLVVVNADKLPQRASMTDPSAVSMARYALSLQTRLSRPVIDRTNLQGFYDSPLPFLRQASTTPDQLSVELEEQLGLKLDPARALVEVLEVLHAENPSRN